MARTLKLGTTEARLFDGTPGTAAELAGWVLDDGIVASVTADDGDGNSGITLSTPPFGTWLLTPGHWLLRHSPGYFTAAAAEQLVRQYGAKL